MRAEQVNRASAIALLLLSLAALLPVAIAGVAIALSGQIPPPEPDEGTGAHIFQLSIAALLPVGLVFVMTANWTDPCGVARRLALPVVVVVVAFALLYYLEHLQRV